MVRLRPVFFFVGLGLVLVLGLWLVGSLQQLHGQVALLSPFLANVLVVGVVGLLVGLLGVVLYYGWLFQRPRRRSPSPRLPRGKVGVARETLRAVQQQVDQIQDEVARRVLLNRSQSLEADLNRRDFRVVVFGTGSAGKTSVVNGLLGRRAGQVAAPMGTTMVGETYQLPLPQLERVVQITDTPGIAEMGVMGSQREMLARQLATEADLLLFVLDNDMRQSEYEPLRMLATIGKRSLVILNKIDRYTDGERETLLGRLRERLQGVVRPEDVVAIAANPEPVQLDTGEQVQPDPIVMPLLRRMAAILRAEGEELIADNILLQSQRLGAEARSLIDVQRQQQADKIVARFQWIGAGVVAVTPLPVVDLLATAAVNAQMVVELGRVYGCELNLERGRELALSLAKTLGSLGLIKGTMKLLTTALQLNLGTLLAARAVQAISTAYLTHIAGKSFIEYFRRDQNWGDGGIGAVVQEQFQLNRRDEFVKGFVQEAIARVIEPLRQSVNQSESLSSEEPDPSLGHTSGQTEETNPTPTPFL